MGSPPLLDHLHLDEASRELIGLACPGARSVALAPLDKGLSGSSVWLARWILSSGARSKLHVFKIGSVRKLATEYEAVQTVASVIEPGFPNMRLFVTGDTDDDLALLRQEFLGDQSGTARSLRQYFEERCGSEGEAVGIVARLYHDRMEAWHPAAGRGTMFKTDKVLYGDATRQWLAHADLERAGAELGLESLEASLVQRYGLNLAAIRSEVDSIAHETAELSIGPVHGDLHAQNVLVDADGRLQLIDFGWTGQKWRAVDFLMMECSLRFLVAPAHATLSDLMILDEALESAIEGQAVELEAVRNAILGAPLARIGAAIASVRHAAHRAGAVTRGEAYRAGLVLMMAGHSTMPGGINRVSLLHCIAHHVRKRC